MCIPPPRARCFDSHQLTGSMWPVVEVGKAGGRERVIEGAGGKGEREPTRMEIVCKLVLTVRC